MKRLDQPLELLLKRLALLEAFGEAEYRTLDKKIKLNIDDTDGTQVLKPSPARFFVRSLALILLHRIPSEAVFADLIRFHYWFGHILGFETKDPSEAQLKLKLFKRIWAVVRQESTPANILEIFLCLLKADPALNRCFRVDRMEAARIWAVFQRGTFPLWHCDPDAGVGEEEAQMESGVQERLIGRLVHTEPLPRLNITFGADDAQPFVLTYRLRDHSVTRRWIKLLDFMIRRKFPITDGGLFYGKSFHNKKSLISKMEENIAVMKRHVAGSPFTTPRMDMGQEELSTLHDEMEWAAQKRFDSGPAPGEFGTAVCNLNAAIHLFEELVTPSGSENLTVILNFDSELDMALHEQEYRHFQTDLHWGDLTLGYNTLGVSAINAYLHGAKAAPVMQTCFRADFSLHLSHDYEFLDHVGLAAWLRSEHGLDASDPKLALGQIVLGSLEEGQGSREEIFAQVLGKPRVRAVSLITAEPVRFLEPLSCHP